MTAQLEVGTARRVTFDRSDGPIAALQSGSPDAPAVLLVPGYTGSKEDFAPLLDPLAAAGLFATAIDLPGQYESPGPDDRTAYAVRSLGAVVRGVAERLGGQVHLLGHSFGGLVARAAVLDAPELFASLTLMSSGPAALDGQRRERLDLLAPVLEAAGMAGVYNAMQTLAASEPGFVAPPAELAAFLERRFLASSPAMLYGMADALRDEPDRVGELAALALPKLVVYGADDDAWAPATQAEMAGRLGAVTCVIPAAGHSPALENAAATVTALIEFWRDAIGSGITTHQV